MPVKRTFLSAAIALAAANASAQIAPEIAGKSEFEFTYFTEEAQFDDQDFDTNASVTFEPEFFWGWENDTLIFSPFYRIDQHDDDRTHGDIRELLWTHYNGNWEFRTGIGKVFWGVTEFNHLVDIINQTDFAESFDGESKFGQPMINASFVSEVGIVDAFILPGFRKRNSTGPEGRPRFELDFKEDAAFQAKEEEKHIDYALRWANSIDVYDVGVYLFNGTDRNPILRPVQENGDVVFEAYYPQITQLGVDAQATIDSWLLKTEWLVQDNDTEDFVATQSGFEYTFYGIAGTFADLGVLLEYGWDERGEDAASIAQNDVFLGGRVALNNTQDTAILFGGSYDMDFHSKTYLIEATQRINDYWSASLNGNVFIAGNGDTLSSFDKDDFIQLTLERFY